MSKETQPHDDELTESERNRNHNVHRPSNSGIGSCIYDDSDDAQATHNYSQYDFKNGEVTGEERLYAHQIQPDQHHEERPTSEQPERTGTKPTTLKQSDRYHQNDRRDLKQMSQKRFALNADGKKANQQPE